MRMHQVYGLLGFFCIFLLMLLSGCVATPDQRLDARVRELCGVPVMDNLDPYLACVYSVLDTHAEAYRATPVVMGDE